jgi:ring-1,2-phenylacetyl-CoA epoxidase subunit PaaE
MAAAAARDRVKRRPGALDVAASALVRVLPRRLEPTISQARLDARMLVDGLRGERVPAFATHATPSMAPTPLTEIDPVEEVLPRPLAERYVTLRRDLSMVLRELRGDRAPHVIPRERARERTREAPAGRGVAPGLVTRTLEVVRVIEETRDARTFELRDASGASLAFRAGQFLTLHVPIDGVTHRRAYSISSSPSDRSVRITVKRIAGGRVSSHLVERVREGDRLTAHGPSGSFVVPSFDRAQHLVLVAGGSGITPIASIVRDVLESGHATRMTLVYGNRSELDAIFKDELEALSRAHGDRFVLVHVMEEPSSTSSVRGIPDAETLGRILDARAVLAAHDGEEPALVMTCGPTPMMAAVRRACVARGVPEARVLEEKFLSPGDPRDRKRAVGPQLVTLRTRAGVRELQVQPEQTVLEAALARGVELPFSCQMGGCGACRVKGSGELVMDEPNCLSDAERADGYVLSCVCRALGPATIDMTAAKGGAR